MQIRPSFPARYTSAAREYETNVMVVRAIEAGDIFGRLMGDHDRDAVVINAPRVTG